MRKGLEVAITPKPFIFVLLQNLSFLQQSYLSAGIYIAALWGDRFWTWYLGMMGIY